VKAVVFGAFIVGRSSAFDGAKCLNKNTVDPLVKSSQKWRDPSA
jgi:hypothetical protein